MKFKLPAGLKKVGFFISSHKAEIATGVSVASGVGAIVAANSAGRKIDKIVEENHKEMQLAKELGDTERVKQIKRKAAWDIAKNYAPTVLLGGLSVGTNIAGYKVAKKENGILTAALAARIIADKKRTENIKRECGDEADRKTRLQPTEEVVENSDGTSTVVVKYEPISAYTYIIRPGNPHYSKDPHVTLSQLKDVEREMNNRLITEDHLFLEDVLKRLFIKPDLPSHLAGWVNEPVPGAYVDFGLNTIDNHQIDRFLEGRDTELILELNVMSPNITTMVYSPQWCMGRDLYREGWARSGRYIEGENV